MYSLWSAKRDKEKDSTSSSADKSIKMNVFTCEGQTKKEETENKDAYIGTSRIIILERERERMVVV
jgi:hypothetical protein